MCSKLGKKKKKIVVFPVPNRPKNLVADLTFFFPTKKVRFHSVLVVVIIYYHCILVLLFNCNSIIVSKLTNAELCTLDFSLSDCHFSNFPGGRCHFYLNTTISFWPSHFYSEIALSQVGAVLYCKILSVFTVQSLYNTLHYSNTSS